MIYEKLNFIYDVEKLKQHLKDHVAGLPITSQSPSFGGWSVTSSNGDFRDGWGQGHLVFEANQFTNKNELLAELKKHSVLPSHAYSIPTEICHGYLHEVVKDIAERGFVPRRVRIIRLPAKASSAWHRDQPDEVFGIRLHVPIETNSYCFFECDEGKAHLPADGSVYVLRVNRMHRVYNDGDTARYHLVMDVDDTLGVSVHHRKRKNENLGFFSES